MSIGKIVRLGPDSISVEFKWRAVPTEVGKLFKPTLGLDAHTAKALFRIDSHKDWKLMDPHSWENDDPRAKEFDLHIKSLICTCRRLRIKRSCISVRGGCAFVAFSFLVVSFSSAGPAILGSCGVQTSV
jgi:hypothetical protein